MPSWARKEADSMPDAIDYKGYRIVAAPYPRPGDEWSDDVHIERHTGPDVRVRNFYGHNRFKSRDDAVRSAIELGRRIIDGTRSTGAP